MLRLADHLEQTGFMMSGWQLDGPSLRVRFHGTSGDLRATLPELELAARAFQAGRTDAWKDLLLQDSTHSDTEPTALGGRLR